MSLLSAGNIWVQNIHILETWRQWLLRILRLETAATLVLELVLHHHGLAGHLVLDTPARPFLYKAQLWEGRR